MKETQKKGLLRKEKGIEQWINKKWKRLKAKTTLCRFSEENLYRLKNCGK